MELFVERVKVEEGEVVREFLEGKSFYFLFAPFTPIFPHLIPISLP